MVLIQDGAVSSHMNQNSYKVLQQFLLPVHVVMLTKLSRIAKHIVEQRLHKIVLLTLSYIFFIKKKGKTKRYSSWELNISLTIYHRIHIKGKTFKFQDK